MNKKKSRRYKDVIQS